MKKYCLALVLIGAINWGLIGIFDWDLVAAIFGDFSLISRAIYIAVGLAGVWMLATGLSSDKKE